MSDRIHEPTDMIHGWRSDTNIVMVTQLESILEQNEIDISNWNYGR